MMKPSRRGDNRCNPWIDYDVVREECDGLVWWIDLAYWSQGAELRVWVSDRPYPVSIAPFGLSRPFHPVVPGMRMQLMRFLKMTQREELQARKQRSAEWEEWKKKFPALAEYVECDTWEDGRARLTSTLLLFMDQGTLKGCLNDREAGRSLWVAGGSIDELLSALEASLEAGTGEWRDSSYGKKPATGKKGGKGG